MEKIIVGGKKYKAKKSTLEKLKIELGDGLIGILDSSESKENTNFDENNCY